MKNPQTVFDDLIPLISAIVIAAGGVMHDAQAAAPNAEVIAQENLKATDPNVVAAALKAIPNELTYDDWIRVSIAVKAAAGEAAYDAWVEWSLQYPDNTAESLAEKWQSFSPPYQVGAAYLFSRAREYGFIGDAQAAFTAVEMPSPAAAEVKPAGELPADAVGGAGLDAAAAAELGLIFRDYIYVEHSQEFVNLKSMERLSALQICRRHSHIGGPKDTANAAAARYFNNHARRRMIYDYTYRPGMPQIIPEPLKNNKPCLNLWLPSSLVVPQGVVSESDVTLFLDLAAYLVPDAADREHFLSWMAYTLQHQDRKINHGILFGGGEGIGKDALLEPLRAGLGAHNVNEIQPHVFNSDFQGWLIGRKLILGQEFHTFERKELMNRLKPLLAAPPALLRINQKNKPETEVPNLVSVLFTTNHRDALMISNTDRRFFVLWSEAEPRPTSFYEAYYAWLGGPGNGLVVKWLMQRDLKGFNAQGRAPATAAKQEMREATLPALEAWFAEMIEDRKPPFQHRLISVADIQAAVPDKVTRMNRLTAQKVGMVLRDAGAICLGRVTDGTERHRLWTFDKSIKWWSENTAHLLDVYRAENKGNGQMGKDSAAADIFGDN